MITYSKKIAEFTEIEFENNGVRIADDTGSVALLEQSEFEQMIEHYNTYKKMKEIDDGAILAQ